jgi:uncharacterized membrane protein YhaH (DUF805 family)
MRILVQRTVFTLSGVLVRLRFWLVPLTLLIIYLAAAAEAAEPPHTLLAVVEEMAQSTQAQPV